MTDAEKPPDSSAFSSPVRTTTTGFVGHPPRTRTPAATISPQPPQPPPPPPQDVRPSQFFVQSNQTKQTKKKEWQYYVTCAVGGACASSIRWILTPLEVLKGYQQVGRLLPTTTAEPVVAGRSDRGGGSCLGRGGGVIRGLRTIWLQEGTLGLFKGLGPTAVAYAIQTGTKLSLYEYLRDQLSTPNGIEDDGTPGFESEFLPQRRTPVWICITSAATAELCASLLMCPWEQVRVQMQTSRPGTFPSSFPAAITHMLRHRTQFRFPFGGLGPLWARQVPGTVVNLFTFETTVRAIYEHGLSEPRESYSPTVQLTVTLAAGYAAGLVCAIVSHPADTLLSLMHQPIHQRHSVWKIASHVGWTHLATRGLAPRALTLGTIIGCQWWIYDSFKLLLGLGTSGH